MSSLKSRPAASAAVQRNIFSAAGLNSKIRCCSSSETMASIAEVTSASSRLSRSRVLLLGALLLGDVVQLHGGVARAWGSRRANRGSDRPRASKSMRAWGCPVAAT